MTTIPAPTEGLTRTERLVPPATPTMQDFCDLAGAVVNRASVLAGEAAELHTSAGSSSAEAERRRIEHQAQTFAGHPVADLLGSLADVDRQLQAQGPRRPAHPLQPGDQA